MEKAVLSILQEAVKARREGSTNVPDAIPCAPCKPDKSLIKPGIFDPTLWTELVRVFESFRVHMRNWYCHICWRARWYNILLVSALVVVNNWQLR